MTSTPAALAARGPSNPVAALLGTLATWHRRAQGRRLLLEMDARQLKDIGLNHGAAAWEAAKPCWRG